MSGLMQCSERHNYSLAPDINQRELSEERPFLSVTRDDEMAL